MNKRFYIISFSKNDKAHSFGFRINETLGFYLISFSKSDEEPPKSELGKVLAC